MEKTEIIFRISNENISSNSPPNYTPEVPFKTFYKAESERSSILRELGQE